MTTRERIVQTVAVGLVVVGLAGIPLGWGLYGVFFSLAGFVCQLTVFMHVRDRVRPRLTLTTHELEQLRAGGFIGVDDQLEDRRS